MERVAFKGVELHRWNCGPSTFLARPEHGARLMHWNLRMADGSFRDVIHWPEEADFSNFANIRGGNPILFPFAGRSFHQGKIGLWKPKGGPVLPMPMHGFAGGGRFAIIEADAAGFAAELQPDETAREAYPYDYTFVVRYVFEPIAFKVYLELHNGGESAIPWAAGHHFYFTLPWHRGLRRRDYRFSVPAKKCFRHAPDGSLQPVKPFSQVSSFDAPIASDAIFSRLKDSCVTFGPNGGEEDVSVRFLDDSDTLSTWNTFVTWTESHDSPFYCVEPWMAPPSANEHGKGLHHVAPGEKASFGVEVALL